MIGKVLAGAIAAACSVAFSIAGAAAAPAPKVHISAMADLPTPLPLPYDASANAHASVAAAFAEAKAEHKRVLIDFGGNWCGDCRVLAGVMELPSVKPFVDKHYVVVTVDVGRFNRNLDIVHRYGIAKLEGVPAVVIATAKGEPLNVTDAQQLADARHMTPQGVADWLAQFAGS